MASADDYALTQRRRLPRAFYGSDKFYRAYNIFDSWLVYFLRKKNENKYKNWLLLEIIHLNQIQEGNENLEEVFLIFTNEGILFVNFLKEEIIWKVKICNILNVFIDEESINIMTKKSYVIFISCLDENLKVTLYNKILNYLESIY